MVYLLIPVAYLALGMAYFSYLAIKNNKRNLLEIPLEFAFSEVDKEDIREPFVISLVGTLMFILLLIIWPMCIGQLKSNA